MSISTLLSRLSRAAYPFRPDPNYEVGNIVFLPDEFAKYRKMRYMLLEERQWGNKARGWVYHGTIYEIQYGELVRGTTGSCFCEDAFVPVKDKRFV